jgi:Primase X
VYSSEEAIARYTQANFLDCRISAYPPNATENPSETQRFIGLRTITPRNIVVIIDLDRCNFKSNRALNMALTRTCNNIKEKMGTSLLTVIWSGNGYHVYLSLDSEGIILENVKQLTDLKVNQISVKFLRFAEWYLSDGKSDHPHNTTVSYNNSMMRVPGSVNSKNNARVLVIKEWNSNPANPSIPHSHVSIKPLLRDFRRYLIDQIISNNNNKKKNQWLPLPSGNGNNDKIEWIERLLQTPIADCRKYCILRILTPYLLNKRKLKSEVTFNIISEWLDRCSQQRHLDFNVSQKIKDGLRGSADGYMPIAYDKLKEENPALYLKIN